MLISRICGNYESDRNFKTVENRRYTNIPTVKVKKLKSPEKEGSLVSLVPPNSFGLSGYFPTKPDGEDEDSTDSHIKWIETNQKTMRSECE